MPALTVKYHLDIPTPSLNNNKGDIDRINASLERASGLRRIHWPLSLLGSISGTLWLPSNQITITAAHDGDRLRVIAVDPGDTTSSHFGLAIDLGTTVVAAELIDIRTGQCLAAPSEVNGQIEYGEDLLTRLHFAGQGDVDALRMALINTVNQLINRACGIAGIDPSHISAVCAAGNTTMTHLFLGLDPSHMRQEPFIPIINHVPILTSGELGLEIAPLAQTYIFPSAGSFLGGDLIAGSLAARMLDHDEITLLLDIGTNGEMILGNKDWLLAGAGAAGPALEGGVAECARRAEPGAIERVKIDPATLEPSYSVIGDISPIGLCGSGLVDVIAQLYLAGLLDATGRFILDKDTNRWRTVNGRTVYMLAEADSASDLPATYITEKDIQNVLRTKAAVVAALTILLDSVGLAVSDIQRVYTAGSFGVHLAVDSAIAIGLYPKLPTDRFVSLGNGSLRGAREILLNAEKIEEACQIADKITYLELNVHPGFMEIFRSAKYI
ncbi:MAG: DUF4445 domain-containing protein [Actinobacteria bacterium]|nr:DUF4445 domain-containing protein [Actinomycetota bacterium]